MKRTPRIEIKVVTDAGTVEYTHRKGDPLKDGTPSPGPSADDFARAQKLILELAGVWQKFEAEVAKTTAPAETTEPDPSEQWEGIGKFQAKCRICGFCVFVGADATIDEHMKVCRIPTESEARAETDRYLAGRS